MVYKDHTFKQKVDDISNSMTMTSNKLKVTDVNNIYRREIYASVLSTKKLWEMVKGLNLNAWTIH